MIARVHPIAERLQEKTKRAIGGAEIQHRCAGNIVQRQLGALKQVLNVEKVREAIVGIPIEVLRTRVPLGILEDTPKRSPLRTRLLNRIMTSMR